MNCSFDNLTTLKCQLAAKKDFVRYISHEIRTPLNTVHVGINLLSESLSSNDKTNIPYQLDLCNDVAVACVTAVDMLNDLLLYDKIEEGNMILEKTLINFHLCYQQTVKMFAVQVNRHVTVDNHVIINCVVRPGH